MSDEPTPVRCAQASRLAARVEAAVQALPLYDIHATVASGEDSVGTYRVPSTIIEWRPTGEWVRITDLSAAITDALHEET